VNLLFDKYYYKFILQKIGKKVHRKVAKEKEYVENWKAD
jgi:hypothetical protein